MVDLELLVEDCEKLTLFPWVSTALVQAGLDALLATTVARQIARRHRVEVRPTAAMHSALPALAGQQDLSIFRRHLKAKPRRWTAMPTQGQSTPLANLAASPEHPPTALWPQALATDLRPQATESLQIAPRQPMSTMPPQTPWTIAPWATPRPQVLLIQDPEHKLATVTLGTP